MDRFNAVSLQGNRSLEQTQDRYICHLFQEKKVVDLGSTIFHGEPELVLANRGFCTDPRSLGHRKSTSSTDSRDLRGEGEGFCDKSTGYNCRVMRVNFEFKSFDSALQPVIHLPILHFEGPHTSKEDSHGCISYFVYL